MVPKETEARDPDGTSFGVEVGATVWNQWGVGRAGETTVTESTRTELDPITIQHKTTTDK